MGVGERAPPAGRAGGHGAPARAVARRGRLRLLHRTGVRPRASGHPARADRPEPGAGALRPASMPPTSATATRVSRPPSPRPSAICEPAGVRLQIAHNNARYGSPPGAWERVMDQIEAARRRGARRLLRHDDLHPGGGWDERRAAALAVRRRPGRGGAAPGRRVIREQVKGDCRRYWLRSPTASGMSCGWAGRRTVRSFRQELHRDRRAAGADRPDGRLPGHPDERGGRDHRRRHVRRGQGRRPTCARC